MSVIIRRVEKKDANDLSELFHEFIGTNSNISVMQEQIDIISKDTKYYVVVACKDDKVIGTSMAILCYDLVGNCNPFMLVENVVVAPQYQGQGVGKMLMKSIENFGIENNCNYVILVSESKRVGSHKFYESIGYSTDQRGFKKRLLKQK